MYDKERFGRRGGRINNSVVELKKNRGNMENPTVFISYSHDNDAHKAWVLKLATDLRSHGVNAILDQWDLRVGSDLRFFMEQGLSEANLVLCICSKAYVDKFNSGNGGSGYEGAIMTQPLLRDAKTDYIISIVRNNESDKKVPTALGSKRYIDFSNDDEYIARYQELLERIYGEDSKKKPPLGKSPFSNDISQKIEIKTKIESVQYHSPTMDGKVSFRFDNNNGIYWIGNGDYLFETRWSRAGNDSIHAYGLIGYRVGESEFPAPELLPSYDFSSRSRTISTGQIVVFENLHRHFAAVKLGMVKSSSHGYPCDEMLFEYHIYSMK